ncbi:hypothetical protein BJ742DRAFT_835889 [Cladochytrium replicatum]|nr:hypothetical protein BJ742DRAFT_835889 [Cladochytrium replicatum]
MTRILKLTDDEVFSNDLVGLLNPTVRAGKQTRVFFLFPPKTALFVVNPRVLSLRSVRVPVKGSPAAGNPPSPVGRTNRTRSLLSEETIMVKQSSVKTWRLPTCLSSPNANPSLVSKAPVTDDLGSSLQAHTAIAGTQSSPIAQISRLFASAPRAEPVDSASRGATGSATFNPLIKESLEVDRTCSLLSEEIVKYKQPSVKTWRLPTYLNSPIANPSQVSNAPMTDDLGSSPQAHTTIAGTLSSPTSNPSQVSNAHVTEDLGSSLQAHTAIAGTQSSPIAQRSRLFASAPRAEPIGSAARCATGSATIKPLNNEVYHHVFGAPRVDGSVNLPDDGKAKNTTPATEISKEEKTLSNARWLWNSIVHQDGEYTVSLLEFASKLHAPLKEFIWQKKRRTQMVKRPDLIERIVNHAWASCVLFVASQPGVPRKSVGEVDFDLHGSPRDDWIADIEALIRTIASQFALDLFDFGESNFILKEFVDGWLVCSSEYRPDYMMPWPLYKDSFRDPRVSGSLYKWNAEKLELSMPLVVTYVIATPHIKPFTVENKDAQFPMTCKTETPAGSTTQSALVTPPPSNAATPSPSVATVPLLETDDRRSRLFASAPRAEPVGSASRCATGSATFTPLIKESLEVDRTCSLLSEEIVINKRSSVRTVRLPTCLSSPIANPSRVSNATVTDDLSRVSNVSVTDDLDSSLRAHTTVADTLSSPIIHPSVISNAIVIDNLSSSLQAHTAVAGTLSSPIANPSRVSNSTVTDELGSSLKPHTTIAGTPIIEKAHPLLETDDQRGRLFTSAPRVEPVDSPARGTTGHAIFTPLITESLEVNRTRSLLSEEMAISLVRSTVGWALETAYRTVQLVDFTCSLPTRAAKSCLSVTYKCAEIAGDLFRRVASRTPLKYLALNLF